MDQLPSTQQIQNAPVIFRNDDGQPLRVFVEASGIVQRPKLVRALKRAGGEICSDPRQAQVILVDSRSFEGRTFIRDWGSDVNKVILEYSWVSRCLAAGRALREDEQWGNCLTRDDGLTLDPDGDFEDDVDLTNNKSPLPTPRVTPVDASVVRVNAAHKAQVSVSMVAEPQKVTDIDTDPPSISQAREEPASASVSSFVQNNDSQYPVIGTQVPSTGTPQYAPAFPSNAQPYPANAALPFHFMQQLWSQMAVPQAVSPFNADAFAMSLADAMRNYGIVPYQLPQTQSVPEPFPGNFPLHGSIEAPASGSLGNDVEIPSKSPTPPPPTPVSRKPKPKLKLSANGHPPQVARRSAHRPRSLTPPEPSTSRALHAKKRKRKETLPEDRRKTIAYMGPFRPPHSTESPPRAPEGSHSHKIFVNHEGEPITFFVQVDQPSRFHVVTSIKKNGGKISNTQTVADYAILHTQSKTFTDLLVSTVEAGKTAVSPAFVYDCVHENSLLDPDQYKFKLGRSKKRAALLSSSSDVEELSASEQKSFSQNRRRQDKKKAPQELQGQSSRNQAVVKVEQEEVEIVLERPRVLSPTPPPAHTRQVTARGYKYPDIEREYALKYVRVLLERDHLMSSQAIAERLYKKLPHHSFGSWRAYINGNMRDDIDKLKKRAAIAFRKAMQQKHPKIVKEEPRDADLNGTTFDVPSNTNAEEERREEEEEDLHVICNFFAYGGGDEQIVGESEDTVWARLSSNVTCKTANSWTEFYDKHYHAIQERYERLIGTITQSNHPEADPGRMNIDP